MNIQTLLDKVPNNKTIDFKSTSYTIVGFEVDLDGFIYVDLRNQTTCEKKRVNIKFMEEFKEVVST